MSVEISDSGMSSTNSEHIARQISDTGWEVSWLPGRVLDRHQATSGMLLVDTVASGLSVEDARWPLLDAWARDLGLSGPEAVVRAATTDEVRAHIARAEAAEARPHLYGVTDPEEKMAVHWEDEAIDFAQLDANEQERWIDDRLAFEDQLAAEKARAAVREARADAVPMTGPVEESEAGEAWSRRVDAAVHGVDAEAPDVLDRWMQAHADSAEPHLHEAQLVAAWESAPDCGPGWDGLLQSHELASHAADVATDDVAAGRG
jgi:hypothetical protein